LCLFSTLYEISFQVEMTEKPDEVWALLVAKRGVIDEEEGRLGTIYCDLFQREGKPAGATNYTHRCCRHHQPGPRHADWDFFHQQPLDQSIINHILPNPALSEPLHTPVNTIPAKPGSYQRRIVVFSCSLKSPDPVSLPSRMWKRCFMRWAMPLTVSSSASVHCSIRVRAV